ncbi:RING-H2 finger protein ATL60-like [Coccinella septempunctata]|uniref:RING-H2 finger protein ATL60-like n=1 Tax=Coccinella septempunctata TaxID=41139 RepID=UPI001D06B186|nr:RING-H2 finger protein ATL60-like [Coccinella septempunctata]
MDLLCVAGVSFFYVVFDCCRRKFIISDDNEDPSMKEHPLEEKKIKVENRTDESTDDNCTICMEGLKGLVLTTKCEHDFHYTCINKWVVVNNTCPFCRSTIFH